MDYYNHDIELALLGRIIFHDDFVKVADILESDHFHRREHAKVYEIYKEKYISFRSNPDVIDILQACKQQMGENYSPIIQQAQELAHEAWNAEEKAELIRQMWMRRKMQLLGKKLETSPEQADVLLGEAVNDLLQLQGTKEKKETRHISELAAETREKLRIAVECVASGEGLPDSIYLGFPEIDEMIGGVLPNEHEVVIIGGRPGMGKTTFALNVARNIAEAGHSVLFYSLDMASSKVLSNMACSIAEVDHSRVRSAKLNEIEHEKINNAFDYLSSLDFHFNESINKLHELTLSAKRWRLGNPDKLGVIFLDYVQLVTANGISAGDTTATTSYVAKQLKAIAKDLSVAIFPLAQLNRIVEKTPDKRPAISYLKESGELEQIAQTIIFPFRPEYYGFESDEEGNSTKELAEMIIAKNRNNFTGSCKLRFVGKFQQFKPWTGPPVTSRIGNLISLNTQNNSDYVGF